MPVPHDLLHAWRNSGLRIIAVTSLRRQRSQERKPRTAHCHWVVHLLIHGRCQYHFPHHALTAEGPAVVLTRPDEGFIQELHHDHGGLWLIIIDCEMITQPGWSDPLRLLATPAVIPLSDQDWVQTVAENLERHQGEDPWNRLRQRPLVDQLLVHSVICGLTGGHLSLAAGPAPRWLDDLRTTMGDPRILHDPDLDLNRMARLAGVHRTHLCRTFSRYYGLTPMQWLRRERISNACRQLRNDDRRPISAIARSCGYRSAALFTRHFHAQMHCSPRTWRQAAEGISTKNAVGL